MPALNAADKKELADASKAVARLTAKLLKPTAKKKTAAAVAPPKRTTEKK